ncbi:MAG TPA: FAD-binding oxidoreductase [Planctomycetaceae bacterium]|nr:FAD-binding oxidoreductase [Planctomycetaceae bacterium]
MNADQPNFEAEFSPSTQDELRAYLAENFASAKRPIVPVGGGTSFDDALPLRERAVKIALGRLDRVVEFAARDMTITVEAGISIARLDEILRGEGLRLPIDIPQRDRATLGGALAANVSGPRRYGLGTFRDYVIGLTAVKADGQVFHSGGRVVKNVAGYDLCKLLVGSLGTLAIVTQVTLKLKPIPEASALVCATFSNLAQREAAVATLLTSQTRPVAIDSLNAHAVEGIENRLRAGLPLGGPAVIVGYEGTQHETDWQTVTLLNEFAPSGPLGLHVLRNADAGPLWSALTEFTGVALAAGPPVSFPSPSINTSINTTGGPAASATRASATASDDNAPLVFRVRLLPSQIAEFEGLASTLPIAIIARAGNGEIVVKWIEPLGDEAVLVQQVARLDFFAQRFGGSFEILRGSGALNQLKTSAPLTAAVELMCRIKEALDPDILFKR